MDKAWEQIEALAVRNGGFLRTGEVEESGFNRTVLKAYVEAGQLERIHKGLYALANAQVDEYALLQARSPKALFSYGTALYFWGMSDRTPHFLDLTVPQGYNASRIKRDNPEVRFHYVKPELYEIGITETASPQDSVIRLYDRERCICDLIRDKEQMDMQLYSQAMKEYFRNHANARKLLKYGKQFGVEEKIRTYMEVLV